MTERSLIFVLGHSIAVGVQSMLRMNIDRAYAAAKRNGIPFYLSYPALGADQQGKGAFDPEFMKGLFENGVARGKSGEPVRAGSRRGAARLASPPGNSRNRSGKPDVNYVPPDRLVTGRRSTAQFNHYSTGPAL